MIARLRSRAGAAGAHRSRPAPHVWRPPNRRLRPDLVRRRRRRAILALAVPLGTGLVFFACREAFDRGLFRVREIGFRGLVHARPSVLAAEAGLTRPRSIFDDFGFVAANLARDPLIRSVRVRREPPARLVVEVEERAPAAYWAADSAIVPVDAEGRVLPLDPARYAWDLPVLMAPPRSPGAPPAVQAGRIVDAESRALLRLVIGIRDRVPEVARRISSAELRAGGRVVLRLMGEGGEVRLSLETPIRKVALLPEVLRDLELKRRSFESVDLSFEDQIVVRPNDLPAPDSLQVPTVSTPVVGLAGKTSPNATSVAPALRTPPTALGTDSSVTGDGRSDREATHPDTATPAPGGVERGPGVGPAPSTPRDPAAPGPAAALRDPRTSRAGDGQIPGAARAASQWFSLASARHAAWPARAVSQAQDGRARRVGRAASQWFSLASARPTAGPCECQRIAVTEAA